MSQLLFYCYPFNFGWEMFYITALCHIFSWEKTYITLLPHVPRGLLTHKNDNVTLYSPIRHTVKYIHWLFIFQTDERWWLRWYTPSLPPHLYLPHICQGQQGMLRSLVMESNLSLPGQQFKSNPNWRQEWIPFTLYWPATWWLFSGFQSNSCSMGVHESKSHHPGWHTLFTETSEKLKSWKSFLGDNPQEGQLSYQIQLTIYYYLALWILTGGWTDVFESIGVLLQSVEIFLVQARLIYVWNNSLWTWKCRSLHFPQHLKIKVIPKHMEDTIFLFQHHGGCASNLKKLAMLLRAPWI